MHRYFIIVNPYSNNSKEVIYYLRKEGINYFISNQLDNLSESVKSGLKDGYRDFIICGGDGTVNKFVNVIMTLSKRERSLIRIGIVPSGRANDLARFLDIPFDTKKALDKIKQGKTIKIDIAKVNGKYFLTGGGVGLPAEVITQMDSSPKNNNFISKFFKESVYYLFVLKLIFFGYNGVKMDKKDYMAVCVMNQSFIGKKFMISKESRNTDGLLELCLIDRPDGIRGNFKVINQIIKGNYFNGEDSIKKFKKLKINLDEPSQFMGDGEIICYGKSFSIEVMPKALNFHFNPSTMKSE